MTPRMRLQPEAMGSGLTSQRVRDRLVERLRANGIADERVLEAVRLVPRHLFVDEALATRAYEDTALPIGHGQTISQPWVVARMTELLLQVDPRKVLEVGTGSGYQAAILAALGLEVHTVERIGDLLRSARKRFRQLGLNVRSKHDDGRLGWEENGPYDAIIVTAAAPALVQGLAGQLAPGGMLVAPVGSASAQNLIVLERDRGGTLSQRELEAVVFVPLLPGLVD
ncbi:protein-L-isoaspartate(D-aspartate) O-methyltransferase [Lysobacter sp. GX 14042]|uniref:protein-L-isoaspartate(D-aspartate) O-methyltransferase n=1 Tax=Lysobacter sp. GX 14042 TaxID=2907155 RepID=UPI001F36E141|nr:protein-L-isoaspartate(D-aspartate) O-methyltransferase [Lysobacter sp. GX 14042]MCE7032579.1 protein-L-isoaspartate(D-aspartate) O-methyltransferase [Lysobacter sp. GX 14042]